MKQCGLGYFVNTLTFAMRNTVRGACWPSLVGSQEPLSYAIPTPLSSNRFLLSCPSSLHSSEGRFQEVWRGRAILPVRLEPFIDLILMKFHICGWYHDKVVKVWSHMHCLSDISNQFSLDVCVWIHHTLPNKHVLWMGIKAQCGSRVHLE